jgi:dipeptidase
MAVLRDHYEGTELDKTAHYRLGNPFEMNGSTICASSTQYGFVAQLRNWLPADMGCIIWLAQYRPDSQAFIPWYFGIDKMPDGYAYGDFQTALDQHFTPPGNIHERTNTHAFWAFVRLADQIDKDYGKRIVPVRQKWDAIEKTLFEKQNGFEEKVLKIYRENPMEAKKQLTDYTNEWAGKAWQVANELQLKMDNQNH